MEQRVTLAQTVDYFLDLHCLDREDLTWVILGGDDARMRPSAFWELAEQTAWNPYSYYKCPPAESRSWPLRTDIVLMFDRVGVYAEVADDADPSTRVCCWVMRPIPRSSREVREACLWADPSCEAMPKEYDADRAVWA